MMLWLKFSVGRYRILLYNRSKLVDTKYKFGDLGNKETCTALNVGKVSFSLSKKACLFAYAVFHINASICTVAVTLLGWQNLF